MLRILNIGRAANANLAGRIEHSQRIGDRLLLFGAEMGRARNQRADRGQVGF